MFEKVKRAVARFADRYLDGHLTVGPLTIYGANAMDWGATLTVRALGVRLCAKPSTSRRGWYFYASPNSTPWAAVLGCGPGLGRENGERIAQRLDVIARSPRPEVEAEKLWDLWAVPERMADPSGGGEPEGGTRDVFNPNTGLFETVSLPDPSPRKMRRFTYDPSDPSGVASA